MADEIALDDWLVSASATPDGGLTIAVAREGAPYATLTVPAPDGPSAEGSAGSPKLKRDMDF